MWQKIKPILEQHKINISSLTPSELNNDAKLLPHLIQQIGEEAVVNAFKKLGFLVFETNNNYQIDYIGIAFLISEKADAIFCTNPFDASIIHQASQTAKHLNLNLTLQNIGFIQPTVFDNLDKPNKNKNPNKNKTLETEEAGEADKKLMTKILEKATKNEVSDIHISPRNKSHVSILFRQFGEIIESGIADIAINKYGTFSNALIASCGGNAGEYNHYLESQFDYKNTKIDISVRLQQNPTIYKFNDDDSTIMPSFVLRVHDKSASHLFKSIEDIGFLPEQQQILKSVSQYNSGVIIVAGPTGSGKTTALYSILMESIAQRKRMVRTIEDPVEITIDNPLVSQTNINKKANVTYENTIDGSTLRSDADVMFIGEIRSKETAKGIIGLDRVGHLILSTIHTKKTISIIDRLREFGASNTSISDALSVILSTRLVKKVCPECSTISQPIEKIFEEITEFEEIDFENLSEEELKTHKDKSHKNKDNQTLLKQLKVDKDSKYTGTGIGNIGLIDTLAIINKKGCPKCVGGYFGRVLVAEVWVIDDVIRELINKNASNAVIEDRIITQGNKTIWNHGFGLVKEGLTTIKALELSLPQFVSFRGSYLDKDTEKGAK